MDKSGFEECAVGDSVSFCAEVYRYVKTGNGKLIDYGLHNPTGIQKIEAYELPSDDELIMQEVEQFICKTFYFLSFIISAQPTSKKYFSSFT